MVVFNVFCQHQTEDSLLLELPLAQGKNRLEILHRLQQSFLYLPKDWHYNNLLLDEAKKQENQMYESIALTNRVAYFQFHDIDKTLYYAKIAEDFTSSHKFYKDLFLVKEIVVYSYMAKGYYSIGLKEALEMYELSKKIEDRQAQATALLAIGDSYRNLEEFDEAIRRVKDARNMTTPQEDAPYRVLTCYLGLLLAYTDKNDSENMVLYMDSLNMETRRVKEKYPQYSLFAFEFPCLLYYASYYIKENRLDEAKKTIADLDKLVESKAIPFFVFLTNKMKMSYYFALKDYAREKYFFQLAYSYGEKSRFGKHVKDLLRLHAEALTAQGLHTEANQYYQKLQEHTDSINHDRFYYEINKIWTDYEVDKRESEIELQRKELAFRFSFNMILIGFSCLLLLAIWVIGNNLRSIRDKNFHLFNQIKELTQTKTELLAFKDSMRIKMDPQLNVAPDSQNTLFERVEDYMNAKKPYINSEYGRKNLISEMNTNEVYLSKAIRSAASMTIQEYINHNRIEYAKTLLLQDMTQTIEAVAMDSGFTTIRNFYRLFKEAYGMSPSEFRNYVKDNL
ncbi:MAG: helix-turn-helix domain-containing protein [Dysgonamonadaceae bacterium]|jgi:AraC-like DNA-binding protein|nr:helix-turn-helix domain-containing protein [Dysgonamonadaceae bacterium]